jgi:DNA-binding NtrC family response regulator
MSAEVHIAGKSKHVEQLRKLVAKLCSNRRDVLVVGESGVGKTTIATILAGNDVLHVFDVASEQEESLQAKLSGLSNGTILFERMEEAAYRVQDAIMAFLERRPQGVRAVVTACASTKVLVANRKLTENLCARINGFERIEILPLRERREDIPQLVKQLANGLTIDINTLDTLVNLPWRENIRELKSVIEKCLSTSSDGRFVLPEELVDERTEVAKMVTGLMESQRPVLDKSLDVIENKIIRRTLERFGFNEAKAAQFLGMSENVFGQKLRKLATIEMKAK